MKIKSARLYIAVAAVLVHASVMAEPARLTLAFVPKFVTTAAPLDEQTLMRMSCLFSTNDAAEIRRFREPIMGARRVPLDITFRANFRQAASFENDKATESYFFKMKSDTDDHYVVKGVSGGNPIGMLVEASTWDTLINEADPTKFQPAGGRADMGCDRFKNFQNNNRVENAE